MKNRVNGKQQELDKEPSPQEPDPAGASAPTEPARKVLSTEEQLAFRLYAVQQEIRQTRAQNAALMQQNAGLADENSKLSAQLANQVNAATTDDMVRLEKDYEFLRSPNVLVYDKRSNEYFLKPVPPQQ